ncbi:ABC transporter permease [Paracoccus aestuariivivens]|uniref:Transport permease protein n=1 Tax=Paracoccus aestuariivivens TaxID=1820333 RepID=A0A6L6JEV3_9RHOB|nr:ABC transporter permease [Paracoccus aestuariivivens]MTH79698.1 sugar ABC transporter permease [Paracoccus aestuariivivens]
MTEARRHPLSRFPAFRALGALIFREMATSYGRSPGGFVWTVLEPVGGIALLTVIFSMAVRVPPMGSSFALFYATGLLPFLMFLDVSRKIAQSLSFSKQLLFYPGVTFVDAIMARFVLCCVVHALVFVIVLSGIIAYDRVDLILDLPRVVLAFLMAAGLGLGVGCMNCFLMRRFPLWSNIWAIATRPLFLVSCIFMPFDSVPQGFRDVLWFNPIIHIVGMNRSAFYSTYRADYVEPVYVALVAAILFASGLALLFKWHRDLAQR